MVQNHSQYQEHNANLKVCIAQDKFGLLPHHPHKEENEILHNYEPKRLSFSPQTSKSESDHVSLPMTENDKLEVITI